MSGVNKVILVGRLGQDPEVRQTPSGQTVCTINLATSDVRIVDGQRQEKTEWHRVILWEKLADLASRFLKKGRMVYIEGRLQTRNWQDAQGQKRYATEIIGSSMQFIDSTRDSTPNSSPEYSSPANEQEHREPTSYSASPSYSAPMSDMGEVPF